MDLGQTKAKPMATNATKSKNNAQKAKPKPLPREHRHRHSHNKQTSKGNNRNAREESLLHVQILSTRMQSIYYDTLKQNFNSI